MTGAQVGRLLSLAPGTLNNWRALGKGPRYVKLEGGVVRYPRAGVLAWMDAQRAGRAA
ncbi:MAG: DNA-binding protein [Dermatophilaceae bacterium]|nr:DNA-binding protein [Dermatophilaceae bacterium]